MSGEENGHRRVHLTSPFPRDSRYYEELTPTEWMRIFDISYSLEAFQRIPLETGTITTVDLNRMHNMMTALAFGKQHVPFILYLQANQDRTGLAHVDLINDAYFDHQKDELIVRPDFHQLADNPQNNFMLLRGVLRQILGRQSIVQTFDGLSIVHSDNEVNCMPGGVAIAGTDWGSLAVGRLVQGNYRPLLTTKK